MEVAEGHRQPRVRRRDDVVRSLNKNIEAFDQKREKHGHGSKSSQPAGGLDKTPIPNAPPGYTVKITFHSASNLPFADISSLSSDPFVMAELKTKLPTRHKQDNPLRWRTPTIRRNVEPQWESEWIIANVPASGFEIKARIYDEDPADHDDRLGNVHIFCNSLSESWTGFDHEAFKIKKRMGSKRAYAMRGCAAMFSRQTHMSGTLVISVEVLGKTEGENGGRTWTVGPCAWSKHESPMIGRLAGTKGVSKADEKTQTYDFQACQIQLSGPVPPELYHRYVEFKPFVAGMFNATSIRGRILHSALRHQHARIYNYDRSTVYGCIPEPGQDLTRQFLNLAHWADGGRIYTYIISLDGLWRFTETGKEFGIDLLSKHTMHSDVSMYIAFSGEFFIRRKHGIGKREGGEQSQNERHSKPEDQRTEPDGESSRDPADFSLVIDNDSGTYRPSADLLPQLKEYLTKNLAGLDIITLDCNKDKEKMGKWKDQQRERRQKEGKQPIVVQGDSASLSSSDISDLEAQERSAA